MEGKLLDLATKKLLIKFGAGNHKPGSGSAAAFQGMLSSHLLHTVITLTLHPDRIENYKEHKEQLIKYDRELLERIICNRKLNLHSFR